MVSPSTATTDGWGGWWGGNRWPRKPDKQKSLREESPRITVKEEGGREEERGNPPVSDTVHSPSFPSFPGLPGRRRRRRRKEEEEEREEGKENTTERRRRRKRRSEILETAIPFFFSPGERGGGGEE